MLFDFIIKYLNYRLVEALSYFLLVIPAWFVYHLYDKKSEQLKKVPERINKKYSWIYLLLIIQIFAPLNYHLGIYGTILYLIWYIILDTYIKYLFLSHWIKKQTTPN